MATVTFASSNTTLSRSFFTLDDAPPGRPREASFSSYLGAGDGSFSLRLSGEFTDQVSVGGGRKKAVAAAHDDELDVFGAEKYFSGGMDAAAAAAAEEVVFEQEKSWRASPHKEGEFAGGRRTRPGTPSEFSEASGNSRSALLRDARRDKSVRSYSQRSPPSGAKKFLGIFPCSCSDKSSVEVGKIANEDDGGGENPASRKLGTSKQVRPEFWHGDDAGRQRSATAASGGFGCRREDCFSFPPALSPPVVVVGNSTVGVAKVFEEEKKARIAVMDVFGTTTFLGKEEIAAGLQRSLAILGPFTAGGGTSFKRDHDACSETSSDLFEIESLSTGTFPVGGGASTTCYVPSEGSIEWSVVTPIAANFPVVGSDGNVSPPKGRKGGGKQQHRPQQQSASGGGLLMGCGSAKAVNVVPKTATYRVPPEKVDADELRRRQRSMDAVVPEIRYYADNPRSVDYEHGGRAAPAGHVLAARGIPRPITAAHAPHL